MHVLMTTDTVGGVWTYTQELVVGLVRQGIRVTLVSMGGLPKAEQTGWMEGLWSLNYLPTTFRLEWMQNSEQDVEESRKYLGAIIREVRPDLLHFNQYCYGALAPGLPRIVVAHSDLVSWWVAVHGEEPSDSHWMRWYRDIVTSGLSSADVVVAPSQWMLDSILAHYTRPRFGTVIHNGRDPAFFESDARKENRVLSVGRAWDAGKQVSLLLEQDQSAPVFIAGSQTEPGCTNERRAREAVRPEIVRIGPGGVTERWTTAVPRYPNGCLVTADGSALIVVEAKAERVVRVPIAPDGSARHPEVVAELPDTDADGISLAADGAYWVTLYRPDGLVRIAPSGTVQVIVDDHLASLLDAPTNIAWVGEALDRAVVANVGGRFLAIGDVGVAGHPLHYPEVP